MPTSFRFEEQEDHLLGFLHFDYTPEGVIESIEAILKACARTGKYLVLVDMRSMQEEIGASAKAMMGFTVEQELRRRVHDPAKMPRVAFIGSAPHILSFRPARDHFISVGLPFNVFTDEEKARAWLFA